MKNSPADKLKKAMKPGRVYRRHELEPYCGSLGRSLKKLIEQGDLVRAASGLYYRPRMTSVGPAPATSKELVRAFLSDDAFLLVDLFNNKKKLSGDTRALEKVVARKARKVDRKKLLEAVRRYGNVATRKFYEEILER